MTNVFKRDGIGMFESGFLGKQRGILVVEGLLTQNGLLLSRKSPDPFEVGIELSCGTLRLESGGCPSAFKLFSRCHAARHVVLMPARGETVKKIL